MHVFRSSLQGFDPLRNAVQHLRGEIPKAADGSEITWGSIAWIHAESSDADTVQSCVLVAGATRKTQRPLVNPADKMEVTVPVGAVGLTAFGFTVSLTDGYERLVKFAPQFERALSTAFEGHTDETLGSDIIISATFGATDERE